MHWPMHPAQQTDWPFVSMERWQARARDHDDIEEDADANDVDEAAGSNVSSSSLENLLRAGTNMPSAEVLLPLVACCWVSFAETPGRNGRVGANLRRIRVASRTSAVARPSEHPSVLATFRRLCARFLRLLTGSAGRACSAECLVTQQHCTNRHNRCTAFKLLTTLTHKRIVLTTCRADGQPATDFSGTPCF